ncbi:hypothetical protein POCGH01_00234500 [Plasmodium ovale]|uniref:Uncharacterized protein n=2 Tax=Plasmodium ovale TaxID=36330 RepID=A0A1A8W8K7_PLAOA|nr:hypothetical protein POVCU2_0053960 [Plasmodium ovale curtisi]SBT84866.1 hypothetical protein POCGH01_00234500 [Plasmodium ovale]
MDKNELNTLNDFSGGWDSSRNAENNTTNSVETIRNRGYCSSIYCYEKNGLGNYCNGSYCIGGYLNGRSCNVGCCNCGYVKGRDKFLDEWKEKMEQEVNGVGDDYVISLGEFLSGNCGEHVDENYQNEQEFTKGDIYAMFCEGKKNENYLKYLELTNSNYNNQETGSFCSDSTIYTRNYSLSNETCLVERRSHKKGKYCNNESNSYKRRNFSRKRKFCDI